MKSLSSYLDDDDYARIIAEARAKGEISSCMPDADIDLNQLTDMYLGVETFNRSMNSWTPSWSAVRQGLYGDV